MGGSGGREFRAVGRAGRRGRRGGRGGFEGGWMEVEVGEIAGGRGMWSGPRVCSEGVGGGLRWWVISAHI